MGTTIYIKVKPNSGKRSIESFGNNRYLVYLSEPPENDKANIELTSMLSKYFGVPPAKIVIKHGRSGDNKMIEIVS